MLISSSALTVATFDGGWYRAITGLARRSAWLNSPMEAYTLASLVLLSAMSIGAWWYARRQADRSAMAAVVWLGVGTIVSVAGGLLLKQLFHEARPCRTMPGSTVQACPALPTIPSPPTT